MMNGKEPQKGCERCYRKEEQLGESFRTIEKITTKQVATTVNDITFQEDGTLTEHSVKVLGRKIQQYM